MTVVRDQLFPQKPPGSRFRFSRTGVQPSPGSSTIELPSAFAESSLPWSAGQEQIVRGSSNVRTKNIAQKTIMTTTDGKINKKEEIKMKIPKKDTRM